ncbi:unnamed protein product [Calicophoron daubneyi]|uniref:Histidine kinase/HSP90-like ATPase domain-containing protein n=1 Tax=Calicophoron daubneyi TaxID=300641 RepID=A0AAV2T5M9_CALDB
MGRSWSTIVFLVGLLAIIACVFGDQPSGENDPNIQNPNEGMSTATDSLTKEAEAISLDGLSKDEMVKLRERAEKHVFQAEVDKMMQLIVNSLYKNKEIFLRELLSNASDALDKIRFLSLTDRDALNATDELSIKVKANKEDRTLHIIDTGIGMTKKELESNLGTIAKSGTSEFLAKVSSDPSIAGDFIGQFGVGFYSSFLVSDKVVVKSKSNKDKQYIWESDSKSYWISEDPRGDTLKRGTEIILYLTEEAEDYLQPEKLKEIVKKYSQFFDFPIHVWASRTESVKVDEPETKPEKEDSEASVEEEKKDAPKTVEKTVWDWVRVNEQTPIWKRKSSEITDEEYKSLYHTLTKDTDDPLGKIHFHAEGDVSFNCVVFIPKRPPGDLFNINYEYKDRIKLYVHRVFISDAAEELIPKYLGFVMGIVDSDSLPLNVSRETLQQNQLVKLIKKKIVRKVIEMIGKLSPEDFETFWKEYGIHIKLGMIEDHSNRARLAKLLRFRSSKSDDKFISLADYVSRMKKDQESIFYLAGPSMAEVKASPLAERLIKKGYEVLYMTDPLDEYMLQSFTEYEKKPLQSVAKEGIKLSSSEKAKAEWEALNKDYADLLTWLKDEGLKDKIEKAELSERLSDSPCALVANRMGWSGNMERIMRSQAHQKGDDSSSNFFATLKKILEVNPRHPLIREMNKRVKADKSDKEAKETAELLFYIATLRSGYALQDSVAFADKVESVMRKNLAVSEAAPVEEEPEEEQVEEEKVVTDEEKNEKSDKEETKPEAPSQPEKAEEPATEAPGVQDPEFSPFGRRLLQVEETLEDVEDDDEDDDDDEEVGDANGLGSRRLLAVKPTPKPKEEKPIKTKKPKGKKTAKKIAKEVGDHQPVHKVKSKKTKVTTKSKKEERGSADSHDMMYHSLKVHAEREKERRKTTKKPKKHVKVFGTINDHDCDGIPDDIDEDIDNDGLLDRTQDSDWDGLLNHVDLDDDNDGIPDTEDEDANGDGIPDCRADTSDHQLITRFRTKKKQIDSDLDGIPDELDQDDDDNGIPDMMEDEDGDQIPDHFHITLEEILNAPDLHALTKRMRQRGWFDHDCDGIPDSLDTDDDNDGFFDNKQDSDSDGILNEFDDDDDNDGIPDVDDDDSNGDGIPDCVIKDSDGDGIPDHIDTDDDNDGIPDMHDPDHPAYNYFKDSDNDGIPDIMDKDDDNDGIPDHIDQDADGDGRLDLLEDSDKDGIPDILDDDMDNDGIPDHLQDHDCDGIPDLIDPDDDNDGFFDNKQDSDNDGILNEWDDDDDNDGIPDKDDEDSNGDGIIDCQPKDSDGDGIPDHLDDDDDNDGVPDQHDPDSMSFLLYKHKRFLEAIPAQIAKHQANFLDADLGDPGDKDCDGIPDYLDNDIDNDGKIDRTQDSDMDGELNHVDQDDDNDGIPDELDPDANGDGIPDCRRDDGLHYKLVKSPSGLIKKVLRIRKPTQEEQHMTFMVNEAKRKLIKVKTLLNTPTPRRPLQTVPSSTPPPLDLNELNEDDEPTPLEELARPAAIHPKILASAASVPNAVRAKPKMSKKEQQAKPSIKTVVPPPPPRQNRKLSNYNPDNEQENDQEINDDVDTVDVDDDEEGEEEEMVNLASEDVRKPSNSFFFAGADAAEPPTVKKPIAPKPQKDAPQKPQKSQPLKTVKETAPKTVKKPEVKKPKPVVPPVPKKPPVKAPVPPKKPKKTNEPGSCDADLCKGSRPSKGPVKPAPSVVRTVVQAKKQQQQMAMQQQQKMRKLQQKPTAKDDDDDDDNSDDEENDLGFVEDEDGDGIPDYLEGDSDGDGIPDYEEDEDGDGIPDYLEDEDGDGIPDYLDEDSSYNRDDDDDNDGVKDYHEDKNHNQKLDILEAKDTDGDGIPDYLDDDDDNDGIPDSEDTDDDNDGIADELEDENHNQIPDYLEMQDSDGDGKALN